MTSGPASTCSWSRNGGADLEARSRQAPESCSAVRRFVMTRPSRSLCSSVTALRTTTRPAARSRNLMASSSDAVMTQAGRAIPYRSSVSRPTEVAATPELGPGAETDPNMLRFEIRLQPLGSHLAADAALFPAAEGGCQLGDVVDVDADATKLQLLGDQERLPEILAEDIGDESVLRAVGTPDDLVERGEAGDWRHGPEGLLAHGPGLVWHVGEDGRLVEMALQEAVAVRPSASPQQARATADGILDMRFGPRNLLLVDHRPVFDARLEPRTQLEPGRRVDEALLELVGERARHVQPVHGIADLAHVGKRSPHRRRDGGIEVGVVEDDHRRVPAKLQVEALHVGRGERHDPPAARGRASEGDHARARGGVQRLTQRIDR